MLLEFLKDESGSELAEYALALALFSMAALGSLTLIAVAAQTKQQGLQTNLEFNGKNAP